VRPVRGIVTLPEAGRATDALDLGVPVPTHTVSGVFIVTNPHFRMKGAQNIIAGGARAGFGGSQFLCIQHRGIRNHSIQKHIAQKHNAQKHNRQAQRKGQHESLRHRGQGGQGTRGEERAALAAQAGPSPSAPQPLGPLSPSAPKPAGRGAEVRRLRFRLETDDGEQQPGSCDCPGPAVWDTHNCARLVRGLSGVSPLPQGHRSTDRSACARLVRGLSGVSPPATGSQAYR